MPESNPHPKPNAFWTTKRILWFGCIVAVIVALIITVTSMAAGWQKMVRIGCGNQLRQIGLRCRLYATEHGGKLPSKWSDLEWGDLGGIENTTWNRVFVCPSTHRVVGDWKQIDVWCDYHLIPGRTTNDPPNTVLAIEPLSNHKVGANVLFVDGGFAWWTAAKVKEQEIEVRKVP